MLTSETAAAITFDAATHEYRLPDGRIVPSVTQILKATGVAVDFEALADRSERMGDAIDLKRDLGTAVHADLHAMDDDDLDLATVDARVRPYLQCWEAFCGNTRLLPLTRERLVFHPTLFYCGTLDGVFLAPDGRHILVDVKTGDPESAGARFQLAGYQLAYQLDHKDPISERWSVQLVPGRAVPYRITPHDDWRDIEVWRAIVTTYWNQQPQRRSA